MTDKKPLNINNAPAKFWQGFWFMCIEHTYKLIALLFTIATIVFFFYADINTKYISKKPVKILENKR